MENCFICGLIDCCLTSNEKNVSYVRDWQVY